MQLPSPPSSSCRLCIVIDFEHSLASPATDLVALLLLLLLLLLRISIFIFHSMPHVKCCRIPPPSPPSLLLFKYVAFFLALPFVFLCVQLSELFEFLLSHVRLDFRCKWLSRGRKGTERVEGGLWHYKWYWKRCVYGPFNTMATQRARAHGKGQCRCLLLLNGAYDLYFVLFFIFFVFVFALMWLLCTHSLNQKCKYWHN